jgi:hypothetical protein
VDEEVELRLRNAALREEVRKAREQILTHIFERGVQLRRKRANSSRACRFRRRTGS